MRTIFLIALLAGNLVGCQWAFQEGAEAANAERVSEYDRQLAKATEQQALTDQQLKVAERQSERMEALLVRWERQADRYDAILSRWEAQDSSGQR